MRLVEEVDECTHGMGKALIREAPPLVMPIKIPPKKNREKREVGVEKSMQRMVMLRW